MNNLFLTDNSIAKDLINKYEYPFEVLPNIRNYILELGNRLDSHYKKIDNDIWISESASVSKTAEIIGPCIIDDNAKIRHNAYIRGSVIIGKNCVVGNSCEIKNSILFDEVEVPHFNYVGDSIIGYKSHLGAGAIISNLRGDKSNVKIRYNGEEIDTNLRKVGAFISDNVEIGCNAVINPGTIIKDNSFIYPLVSVKGYIPSNSIIKKDK